MRRPLHVLAVCIGLTLASEGLAHAQLESSVSSLGKDVSFKLLHGYPHSASAVGGPLTVGLELTNMGRERELHVRVEGEVDYEQRVQLAAGERKRWFAYLPVRQYGFGQSSILVTDLATGARKQTWFGRRGLNRAPVARIGPISVALNVDKPFTLLGALDGFMPDDWRGLAGIRVIVIEHDYALAHPPDWRVLADWLSAGGLLVIATPVAKLGEPMPPAAVRLPLAGGVEETSAGLLQRVGLGAIARVYPEELATLGSDFWSRIDWCENCGWTADLSPRTTAETAFQRLRNAVQPAGWPVFGVLLGFVLAVGPFGYVVFVRRRKQPLAYIGVTLAAALGFSLLVLAVDLTHNGLRARVIPQSLVIVDQRTDTEFGVEELAAHVPLGRSFELHQRPGMQLLLPNVGSDMLRGAPLSALQGPSGLALRGAVPARERRLLGARWLSRARGRLIVSAAPGGLHVENHLGCELSELSVWHHGVEHTLAALPIGGRSLATPAPRSRDDDRTSLLRPPLTAAAHSVLWGLAHGRLGEDRYIARFRWNPASSGVLDDSAVAFEPGTHVIAGVY